MPLTEEQRRFFARIRSENLSTEIKQTLDLGTSEGRAKLVKGCQAIFNRNGGFLIVGFDNKGDPIWLPPAVFEQYTPDAVQEIISKHCKPNFEVDLDFIDLDGARFPVVIIPAGVRVPSSVRKEIKDPDGKIHLPFETIYFRTLAQNGRASTAPLRPDDFPELLNICFANRETDIAGFLRKHLPDLYRLQSESDGSAPNQQTELRKELLKFDNVVAAEVQSLPAPKIEEWLLKALALTTVVACDPPLLSDGIPTQSFLSRVYSSNPNLTGWPVWMDSRNFTDRRSKPHVSDNGWNVIIPSGAFGEGLEVYRFDPSGKLFFHRVMQDDTSEKVKRGTLLDPALMVYRIAEVVIVALSIFKGLGAKEESTAHFAFRWTGLKNRKTGSWSDFNRYFSARTAYDDEAWGSVSIPVELDPRQIAPIVSQAVRPLFANFEGWEISQDVVEKLVIQLVERRW